MKTKNKKSAKLLGLLMIASCIVGLSACDTDSFCLHEWSEYTITAEATCEKEGKRERKCASCGEVETQKLPALEHIPGEDDGDCTTDITCTVCGEVTTKGKSKHRGGTATCASLAKCNVCKKEYGELLPHNPDVDDGDCTTALICLDCGGIITEANAAHTGGRVTCTELAICEVCGMEYGELASHPLNPDDGDCTTPITCKECGDVIIEANESHTGGTATCTELAICQVCGIEYGELLPHNPDADDGDCTTDVLCLVCGEIATAANESHTGGEATCEALAQCQVCGIEYGEFAPHIPDADDGDCTTAVLCSICQEVITEANESHTGGEATCEALAQCQICGTEYGEFVPHIPEADDGDCSTDPICTVCGEELPGSNNLHTGGEATCKHLAICEVCGKEYGELAGHGEPVWLKRLDTHYTVCPYCHVQISDAEEHTMVDGACSECGFNPTITVTSTEVAPGDTQVRIAVSITDNPGITGLMLRLQYNSDVFTLTGAQSGEALDALAFTAPSELANGCSFLWDGIEITDGDIKDGELLILTFDVSFGAPEGEYSILLKTNAYDNDLTPFTLIIKGGSISIINN